MHVITTRWNWNRCVAAGTAAFIGAFSWPDLARADAVTDWHEIAENTLCTASPMARGPSTIIDIAIVHTAVYDAVQNIGGKYKPYHVQISGASGSPGAAVAKAAHDTLANLFPTKAQDLGTTYKEYLAKKGLKEDDPGVAVGQKAAAGILALRADDGRAGPNPMSAAFIGENAVGKWRTTPPQTGYFDQMRAPWMGAAKPFVIQSGSQFRANPPPDLKSDQYTKDYNEVKGGGFTNNEVRLTRSFGKSEVVKDLEKPRTGGHGGADSSIQDQIFRGPQGSDPLNLRAGLRDGALSSLIGIAARHSIERGNQAIKIQDLVKL